MPRHHQQTIPLRIRPGLVMITIILAGAVFDVMADGLPVTIDKIKTNVVGIGSVLPTRTPPAQLHGTGFVVADGNHVLTNAHVVSLAYKAEKNEFLAVFIGRGTDPEVRQAEKVAVDYEHDMALLKISGLPLPAATLGNSNYVREGERYAFTGYPIGSVLGLYPATHTGIVAAITPIVTPVDQSRQLDPVLIKRLRSPYNVFQLDATVYPGNSGSPLYDPETGKVVGIVNMTFIKGTKEQALSEPSGIGYAIPIKYAEELLRNANLKHKSD